LFQHGGYLINNYYFGPISEISRQQPGLPDANDTVYGCSLCPEPSQYNSFSEEMESHEFYPGFN